MPSHCIESGDVMKSRQELCQRLAKLGNINIEALVKRLTRLYMLEELEQMNDANLQSTIILLHGVREDGMEKVLHKRQIQAIAEADI